MEDQHLSQPLIPTTTTGDFVSTTSTFVNEDYVNGAKVSSSNSTIIFRLVLIIFTGLVSIYANLEASKGFSITIINEAGDTTPGKRFNLFYESNDKATRIVLNTSKFVEDILYPDNSHPKNQINHISLCLASRNLTHSVIVDSSKEHEFVIHLSPCVLEENNFSHAMLLAVQKGMARIWLWDGQGKAPPSLINGMVEYITSLAGFGTVSNSGGAELPESDDICRMVKDLQAMAQVLNYCESQKLGSSNG